jgi:hypothetical protein
MAIPDLGQTTRTFLQGGTPFSPLIRVNEGAIFPEFFIQRAQDWKADQDISAISAVAYLRKSFPFIRKPDRRARAFSERIFTKSPGRRFPKSKNSFGARKWVPPSTYSLGN